MAARYLLLAFGLSLALACPAAGQQGGEGARTGEARADRFYAGRSDTSRRAPPLHDEAWTPFFEHEGVAFSFIRYRRADGENAGVVLRLFNENDFAVRYQLRLAFLSMKGTEERWRTGRARGVLEAGETKTGENGGLFWVPFRDSSGIAEVRLPAYQITPME